MEEYESEVRQILGMIGLNLKLYRAKAGLTQEALAELSGVSRPNISNIELGVTSPSISTLVLLASVLKVTVRDFFNKRD